ncbi:MAG: hypothetical protein WC310_03995 [Patescibacteria group bacterium]|jgi:hypothetical protein
MLIKIDLDVKGLEELTRYLRGSENMWTDHGGLHRFFAWIKSAKMTGKPDDPAPKTNVTLEILETYQPEKQLGIKNVPLSKITAVFKSLAIFENNATPFNFEGAYFILIPADTGSNYYWATLTGHRVNIIPYSVQDPPGKFLDNQPPRFDVKHYDESTPGCNVYDSATVDGFSAALLLAADWAKKGSPAYQTTTAPRVTRVVDGVHFVWVMEGNSFFKPHWRAIAHAEIEVRPPQKLDDDWTVRPLHGGNTPAKSEGDALVLAAALTQKHRYHPIISALKIIDSDHPRRFDLACSHVGKEAAFALLIAHLRSKIILGSDSTDLPNADLAIDKEIQRILTEMQITF